MSGAAGEELSSGGKRTSSALRLFIDRHEYEALPLVFALLVLPSVHVLSDKEQAPGEAGHLPIMAIEYIGLNAVGWHVMTGSWHNIVCCLRCCHCCYVEGVYVD